MLPILKTRGDVCSASSGERAWRRLALALALVVGAAGCGAVPGDSSPPPDEARRGNAATVLAHSPGTPGLLAVDATRIYWTDRYTSPTFRDFFQLVAVSKTAGGDPQSIFNVFLPNGADSAPRAESLTALDGVVYLATTTGDGPFGSSSTIQHTIVNETDPSMSTTATSFQFDTPHAPGGVLGSLFARSDGLYFLGSRDSTDVPDNFWRTGLGGSPGAAMALNGFPLTATNVKAIAFGDDGIYWIQTVSATDATREIHAMPYAGSASDRVLAQLREQTTSALAVGNGAVYWSDGRRGAIMTTPTDGSGPPTIVTDAELVALHEVTNLLVDSQRLYWLDPELHRVASVRLTRDAQPEVLATVPDGVNQLVQDDASLYWLSPENHGAIYALRKPH